MKVEQLSEPSIFSVEDKEHNFPVGAVMAYNEGNWELFNPKENRDWHGQVMDRKDSRAIIATDLLSYERFVRDSK